MSESRKSSAAIQPANFDAPGATNDTGRHGNGRHGSGRSNSKSSTAAVPQAKNGLSVREGAPWWHSQFNMMLCAFALLAAAALLVVVLIPKPAATSQNIVLDSSGESTVTDKSVSEATPGASSSEAPWSESRRQQARSDAQDLLADLLSLKKSLEAKKVTSWAKAEFEAALQAADLGDEFYKSKDFGQALVSYQEALNSMQNLDNSIPKVVATFVKAGDKALASGKSNLAKEKFQSALTLDQNHIPALSGLDRASTLDKVLALVESAQLDQQAFVDNDKLQSLLDAEQKYQSAIALDAQSEPAIQGQKQLAVDILDKRYRIAMTAGFNDLFATRYNKAKQGFSEALKLKPNDATASSAYRQSLASDKRSSLGSLIANGKALEKREEWSQALSTYQTVLQRDANQVGAKLGVIRSKTRNDLDQSLRELLEDPLALSKANQRSAAEGVLNDARALKLKGPILKQQISSLEAVFNGLDTTLKVEFSSDNFTDVYLLKEGSRKISLGRFAQQKMALKPGRYVLTGSRLGYVDVRREINLQAGNRGVLNVSIICETPIGQVSVASGDS